MPLDLTPPGLDQAFRAASPRVTRPPTPLRAVLIHGGIALLWAALLWRGFTAHSLAAWSAGLVYIAYDTALLAFVALRAPGGATPPAAPPAARPSLAVLIAARDEAASLPRTLAALEAQTDPPDTVLVADDGSTDATAATVRHLAATRPWLRLLALPPGGKAAALNAGWLTLAETLVVTIDADTHPAAGALAAMRAAFAADPALVAATGVLEPICAPTRTGRLLRWFQSYEYVRNFLSRHAWARADGLVLVSGAFAGFRREAVLAVGGFDPDCLVEDYEILHRLRRHGARAGLGWRTGIVGAATAETEAPSTPRAFLRQRRRWFGGFLQVQFWYRDMVGNPAYGRLGTWMLPVKAADTLQPIYGLTALALLPIFVLTSRAALLLPVGGIMGAKVVLDIAFHAWGTRRYRRWTGAGTTTSRHGAVLASLAEPLTFQVLRHTGAMLGWVTFLTGTRSWGRGR